MIQEPIFFDFSIASKTWDLNMASRGRTYTVAEVIEAIFLNGDSERDENNSDSDSEPRTGGSVGWAPGCHAGGREFNSGRTNTQGL